MSKSKIFEELFAVIEERKKVRPQGSYTAKLMAEGKDKILKKIAEESGEVIIAGKGGEKEEIIYESADLIYHLFVLLSKENIKLEELCDELKRRRK